MRQRETRRISALQNRLLQRVWHFRRNRAEHGCEHHLLLLLRPHRRHLHAALGQGAGLVGEDDGRIAERLRGAQALDKEVLPRQAKGAEPQHHGDDDGQFLGNRGKCQR